MSELEPERLARVLVVDDDPDIRLLFTLALSMEPWTGEMREADDGRDMLDVIASGFEPDCVVTGLMMPNMNGFESIPALRATGYAGGIVVCASIVGNRDFDFGSLEPLVDVMLGKPVLPDELSVAVKESVDRYWR